MDTATRNALQTMVIRAREVLSDEILSQLEAVYGIQRSGAVAGLETVGHLSDEDLAVAALLRERLAHLVAGGSDSRAAVTQEVREQAFTIINRFSALRLAEERQITRECVRRGYESQGFKLFQSTAGNPVGDTHGSYRMYVQCLFDELSLDLGVLFDRFSPSGLLFPREPAMEELLRLLNQDSLAGAWPEDETIGWIYQFFNTTEERKKMREQSPAPRNSHELAVRNQFFTPRYVVQFLTDNTLGRIWMEMMKGETALARAMLPLCSRRTGRVPWGEKTEGPAGDRDVGSRLWEHALWPVCIRPLRTDLRRGVGPLPRRVRRSENAVSH